MIQLFGDPFSSYRWKAEIALFEFRMASVFEATAIIEYLETSVPVG